MAEPSAPRRVDASVREVVERLAAQEGESRLVEACTSLLAGAAPESLPRIAVALSRFEGAVDEVRASGFHDYWWRTWGARGLLYVWADDATAAVVRGLADDHWRPAEMCLKVAAKRELAEAADGAVPLSDHELPRVRATAHRLLGVAGDTEHVAVVRGGLADEDQQVRRAAALALERMVRRLDLPGDDLP